VTDVVRDPTRIKTSGATCQLEAFADLQIAADLPQLLRMVPGLQAIGDGILVGAARDDSRHGSDPRAHPESHPREHTQAGPTREHAQEPPESTPTSLPVSTEEPPRAHPCSSLRCPALQHTHRHRPQHTPFISFRCRGVGSSWLFTRIAREGIFVTKETSD